MAFTIIWKRSVIETDLPAIVVRAMERGEDVAAITSAMSAIDNRLMFNPGEQGESRGNTERILIVPPLSVTFEIHDEERIVLVLTLRYFLHRPRT
jgi:hypothetical protein